jgi:TolB-like protein/Flp pilus assembly protein TadD
MMIILLFAGGVWFKSRPAKIYTVAVLPITNQTLDPENDYLGEGLAESLAGRLSKLPNLRIKAAPPGPATKAVQATPRQIGRELKSEAAVAGTVTQSAGSLMLEMKLIKIDDGAQLWGASYKIEQGKLLELQHEVVRQIIAHLPFAISEAERLLNASGQTTNPEAYRLYLLGRHCWSRRNRENLPKAIGFFQQAIERDPLYAQAYAGLADSYVFLPSVAYGSLSTKEAMSRAKEAVKHALTLDPQLCEAHTSLGVYLLRYEWDWKGSEKEFRRAIELNDDYAPAHYWYSNLLALTGRFDESIAESNTVLELEPLSPLSETSLGKAYYYSGQFERAAEVFLKILGENPNNQGALYLLAFTYAHQGRLPDSIALLEQLATANRLLAAAPLGYAYARVGRRGEALKILAELDELSKTNYLPPQERAIIYLGLDNRDAAFVWLK